MIANRRLPPTRAAAALLVVWLAGCQQVGGPQDSREGFPARLLSGRVFDKADAPVKLGSKQKADVLFAMARSLEKQGKTKEAIEVYRDVVRKDKRRADALHRLAILHDKTGDHEAAAKLYDRALKIDDDNAELLCDLGYSCYLQQRWQDAEKNLRRAISLKPDLARAHNNLGLLLAHTERNHDALVQFAKAGSREAEGRSNLAIALALNQKWDEAEKEFELALRADPSSKAARQGMDDLQSTLARAGVRRSPPADRLPRTKVADNLPRGTSVAVANRPPENSHVQLREATRSAGADASNTQTIRQHVDTAAYSAAPTHERDSMERFFR